MTNIHPHPEWKRLAEEIRPLLITKQQFTYAELRELAGVDIQTQRGRQQMLRFQRHALREWGLWFECERGEGYRVTEPKDHPVCAGARLKRGRRQIRRALHIVTRTLNDGATPEVLTQKRQMAASCGAILSAAAQEAKQIRQIQAPALVSSAQPLIEGLAS